ncbi:MAG: C39 family peptidase [Dehalococcoidia bacterium]
MLLAPVAEAGCGTGDADCLLEPPQSEEVNPDPGVGDGLWAGAVGEAGSAAAVEMAMPLPRVVAVGAEQGDRPPAPVDRLPVPMRYQDSADPGDMSCGIQALGMALDGLGGAAPTSAALTQFLERAGMLYGFGTGVEELALAAQAFGYAGSLPIHDASLDDLRAQLDLGRPVVVSLGVNGEGQPGHFVTVTGISGDGQWVAYNDPALGPQTMAVGEFLRLWALEGMSGVVVAREPLITPEGKPVDAAPWVVLLAGVMALVSATPLGLRRKGIGGHANPPRPGGRWVWKEEPVYETRLVQEGTKEVRVQVPRYETVREKVTEIVEERVAVMRMVTKQDGWATTVERVPVYGTERYISGYRTVRRQVPEYMTIGKRQKLIGYRTEAYREAVYATRRVQTGWREVERKAARMVRVEEFDHWQMEAREVTRWVEKQVQTGWDTVVQTVPRMVEKRVQVGTEGRWVWEEGDARKRQSPLPPDDRQRFPEWRSIEPGEQLRFLPMPPHLPFVEIPGIAWDVRALKLVRSAGKAQDLSPMAFRALEGGYVSVSGPAVLRDELELAGTRYLPTTVAQATGRSLVRSAISGSSVLVSGAGSIAVNLFDYSLGEHCEDKVGSQEFWVSTGVDFGLSVVVGILSACAVAGAAALAATVFSTAIAASPLVVTTAVLGIGFSLLLEALTVPEGIKSEANEFVDAREVELNRLADVPHLRIAPRAPLVPLE